jgi:hypothetical protein
MAAISPPAPVNPTGQLAQSMSGYDPAPVIAAQEQSLQDFLNLPVKEILARLGLPPVENAKPEEEPKEEQSPEGEQPPASPFDPSSLISPLTDALGTLGPGLFEGVDPTAMLQGISQAFRSTGGSLQPALAAVADAWQGDGGSAAAAKTTDAIANGADVGAQSDALRSSLGTAAADVGQARVQLIAIISEFMATLAAIGPNIIFPWGWAAAIAAANKAIASGAEVMTTLQASLAGQAAQVTAAGTPVDVTSAPQAGSGAGMAPQLMQMAMKGAQAGIQAGTGAASSASQAASESATKATDPATTPLASGAAGASPLGAGKGGGGGGVGVGGGTVASRLPTASPMVQPETTTASAQSAPVRAASAGGTAGAGMMGAPYAPMAGQGANSSSNSHSAATFLHTTDQGGEIVGDLGTAAPPVLGETDPNETPDIELRI